jgi:hypothetical protein
VHTGKMQLHRLLVMVAISILPGCSSEPAPAFAVSIDPGFTMDQVDAITAAVDDWKAAVPQMHMTYAIATCGAPWAQDICMSPAHSPTDPTNDVVGFTSRGAADNGMVSIYVNRIDAMGGDARALTQQTAAHELGHAMGLQHAAAGTLMAALVDDQAETVTPADVAQFWAVRGR